jgi:hypothetical protein
MAISVDPTSLPDSSGNGIAAPTRAVAPPAPIVDVPSDRVALQPSPAPAEQPASFQDIEHFASARELQEAAGDPAKLQQFLGERVSKLHEAYAEEVKLAEYWRTLTQDEGMRQHILSYGQPQSAANGQRRAAPPASDELAQLKREVQALRQERTVETKVQADIREMAAKHPDLSEHIQGMQQIMQQNPGVSLAFAYQHAKLLKASAARSTAQPPVSERPTAGFAPAGLSDRLTALQSSLQDRGKFRTTEEAARHAVLELQKYAQ